MIYLLMAGKRQLAIAIFALLTIACLAGSGAIQTVAPATQPPPDLSEQPARTPAAAPEASPDTPTVQVVTPAPLSIPSTDLIQPADLTYLGAFRLPDGSERPLTFEYGGNAMTFRPGAAVPGRLPGSLFISGHDRLPYGELPDGSQIAEVTIPEPALSRSLEDLPRAEFIQGFQDVAAGRFTQMEEIVRMGMLYLDIAPLGARIHLAWGQHFEPEPPAATHAWFNPDLTAPDLQGVWYIDDQSFYAVNDYLFEIPADWADACAESRYIATGRFRDGGWSGMGPALFAYRPWLEDGSPSPAETHLPATTLLLYESSLNNERIERSLNGYQHPDEWSGGAWLTTPDGHTGLIFAGTKATGTKYWYGYTNPAGAEMPCVDDDFVGQFTVCRLADGSPCPETDLVECSGHDDYRGWWSSHFDAQFIFYNPDDLARVARGEMETWQPQPYTMLDIDEHLYFNPPEWEQPMLGRGDQRRYRIGDVAYDRENGLLYVLELFADGARPVVHVWRVE
jgi:hypothetical protein